MAQPTFGGRTVEQIAATARVTLDGLREFLEPSSVPVMDKCRELGLSLIEFNRLDRFAEDGHLKAPCAGAPCETE